MKHLIITGATGNLGRELINHLNLDRYDKIYLVGSKSKFTNFTLEKNNLNYLFDYDLTDENSVKELFDRIDINENDLLFVIHLVGGYLGGRNFWEYSKEEAQKLLEKNFISSFLIAKYSFLKAQNGFGGSLFFISAFVSLEYSEKRSVYAISKNALNYLVKVISKEARKFNFTANAIAPFIILTEDTKKYLTEEDYIKCSTPEDIAKIINSTFENFDKVNGNIITLNEKH